MELLIENLLNEHFKRREVSNVYFGSVRSICPKIESELAREEKMVNCFRGIFA